MPRIILMEITEETCAITGVRWKQAEMVEAVREHAGVGDAGEIDDGDGGRARGGDEGCGGRAEENVVASEEDTRVDVKAWRPRTVSLIQKLRICASVSLKSVTYILVGSRRGEREGGGGLNVVDCA